MQALRKQRLANLSKGEKSRTPEKLGGSEPVNIAIQQFPPEVPNPSGGASSANKTGGKPPRVSSTTEGGGSGGNFMPNPQDLSKPSSAGAGSGTESRSQGRTIRTDLNIGCQKELRNDPRYAATVGHRIEPLTLDVDELAGPGSSPGKRTRDPDTTTSKRSKMEAKRIRDEEDHKKFAARPPSEKAGILVLQAERVCLLSEDSFLYAYVLIGD